MGQRREFEERTGPPIAPKRIASASFAALRASSVSGEPVTSIEAFRSCQPVPLATSGIGHPHTTK